MENSTENTGIIVDGSFFTESCFYVSIVDKSERGRYPDPKKNKEFSLSSKQLN